MRASPFKKGHRITQRYWSKHTGYDLVAVHEGKPGEVFERSQPHTDWIGAPIVNVEEGVVWFVHHYPSASAVNNRGGNFVIVQSGNRWWYYGHLRSVAVVRGEHVKEGDILGYQGATGPVTGEHLHFELRIGGSSFARGKRVDVFEFIKAHTPPPPPPPAGNECKQIEIRKVRKALQQSIEVLDKWLKEV